MYRLPWPVRGVVGRNFCDDPVTILDLHATFLEVAGADPSNDADSRSMAPYLAGAADCPRDVVFSGLGAWRLAFDGRYKLVLGYDPEKRRGGEEWEPWEVDPTEAREIRKYRSPILYDVQVSESENVADHHPEIVKRLSERLEEM